MAITFKKIDHPALAAAITCMQEHGIGVDVTGHIPRDERGCFTRMVQTSWKSLTLFLELVWRGIERYVIRPLMCLGPLQYVMPLYAKRLSDPNGGLNAFLHLTQVTSVMRAQFSSLEFAFKQVPAFRDRIAADLGDAVKPFLRRPLEAVFDNEQVQALLNDTPLLRQVMEHLTKVKEWELYLDRIETARAQGEVLHPEFETFMRTFVEHSGSQVDPVELFHAAFDALPYTPAFYGFISEQGRVRGWTDRYRPPHLPYMDHMDRVRGELEQTLPRDPRWQEAAAEREAPPSPGPGPVMLEDAPIDLESGPFGVFALPFTPDEGIGFNELLRRHFNPPKSLKLWEVECDVHVARRISHRKRQFESLPTDVYFTLARLRQDKQGHKSGPLTFHRDHLNVPFVIHLPRKMGADTVLSPYELAEFIAYQGDLEFGHYAYYKKDGDQWYEVIDDRPRLVSFDEIRHILNDRSLIHHYHKARCG